MTAVVDTSVLLARMVGEPGAEALDVSRACLHVSMVNLAEFHTKIIERGGTIADANRFLKTLPIRYRAIREADAEEIGRLRADTRHRGLSLGDRACLALARANRLPVWTADRVWADLDIGVEIVLIR